MTLDDAIDGFARVAPEAKGRFLVALSYELTVRMRGCYDETDVDLRATKLRGANEIQHHLVDEAHHHLVGNLNRYPDEVLIRSCVESGVYKLPESFRAFIRCLDQYERRST